MNEHEHDRFSDIILNLEKRMDRIRENAFEEQQIELIDFLENKYGDKAKELVKTIIHSKRSDYIVHPKHYPITSELLDKVKSSPTLEAAKKLITDALDEQKESDLEQVRTFFETAQSALEMSLQQIHSFRKASERIEPGNHALKEMQNELKKQLEEIDSLYKEVFK